MSTNLTTNHTNNRSTQKGRPARPVSLQAAKIDATAMLPKVQPMLHQFANKIAQAGVSGTTSKVEREDVLSYFYLVYLDACGTYKPAFGTSFSTHLYNALSLKARCYYNRECLFVIHIPAHAFTPGSNHARVAASLDEPGDPLNASGGHAAMLRRWAKAAADNTETIPERLDLAAVLSRLGDQDREILIRHADGEALADIAKGMGITRERVRQIHKRAIVRARAIAGVLDNQQGGTL